MMITPIARASRRDPPACFRAQNLPKRLCLRSAGAGALRVAARRCCGRGVGKDRGQGPHHRHRSGHHLLLCRHIQKRARGDHRQRSGQPHHALVRRVHGHGAAHRRRGQEPGHHQPQADGVRRQASDWPQVRSATCIICRPVRPPNLCACAREILAMSSCWPFIACAVVCRRSV